MKLLTLLIFCSGEFSGLNQSSLWIEEHTYRVSFLNRLYFDYIWSDFRIGGRFRIDESLREDSITGEILTQRYLGYTREPFSFWMGNFYETFGQGLTLSLFEEEELNIDRNIDGIKGKVEFDRFNLEALGGRPRNENGKREDLLYGVEASLFPSSYLTTQVSYLRFDATNTPEDSSFGLPVEEWIDLTGKITTGPFDITTDYAKGYKWGEYDSSRGWVGVEQMPCYGIYLSLNLALSGLGINLGYKDYENLDLRFNSPPPLSHSQRSLNEGKDERGFQIESQFTPKEGIFFNIGYSNTWAKNSPDSLSEIYIGSELWWKDRLILSPSYDVLKFTKGREITPYLGIVWYLNPTNTLEIEIEHKDKGYREDRLSLAYSYSGLVFGGIYENTTDPLESQTNWLSGYCKVDWGNYNLELSWGAKRKHLQCIGGICYYEPSFKGAKIVFTLRF